MLYLWRKMDMDNSGTLSSFELETGFKSYKVHFPKIGKIHGKNSNFST